ncbi:MAG: OmpA family protein [Saprospiraceae bacterium]|nr:OmpA family protein [Saprospiraceae bacterium]
MSVAQEALKKLSEDRAAAIKHKLIEKGVPESRISTYGYGGARPIAANDTEENKSKNRRVEIRIVSQ